MCAFVKELYWKTNLLAMLIVIAFKTFLFHECEEHYILWNALDLYRKNASLLVEYNVPGAMF